MTGKILVGYFQDEVYYQGPFVALMRHLEKLENASEIHIVDLSGMTNSSSFTQTARLFGMANPVRNYIDSSPRTKWVESKEPETEKLVKSSRVDASILSDLYSSMQTHPLPRNLVSSLLARKFRLRAQKIYGLTLSLLKEQNYTSAYVLNGRHSANAAFWSACQEMGTSTFFWECSNDFKSIVVFDHPIHDFFSFEKKVSEMKMSGNHDVEKAEAWLRERIYGSTTNEFSRRWRRGSNSPSLSQITRERPLVTYFSSSSDEYMSLGEMSPKRRWDNQYQALEALKLGEGIRSLRLVIRMHPNTVTKSPTYCLREVMKVLHLAKMMDDFLVIWPRDKMNSYDLVRTSSCVLSSGSTIALEAMYLGIPTIHLDHSYYFHASSYTAWKPSNDLKALIRETNLNEQKHLALLEIQARIQNEIEVRANDQVNNWNSMLSVLSFRDFYRIWAVIRRPIWKALNIGIFKLGSALVFIVSAKKRMTRKGTFLDSPLKIKR